jgi:hypothetical protein
MHLSGVRGAQSFQSDGIAHCGGFYESGPSRLVVVMTDQTGQAVHLEPVWRERSNFVIAAEVPDGGDTETEQLWARQIDEHRFEICCIPFFVFDIALGDVVETDHNYLVRHVVEPSGRYVFRVWFGESFHPRDEIGEELKRLGALIEWSSVNLLAVDATDEPHAQEIADILQERQDRGQLLYETGRS